MKRKRKTSTHPECPSEGKEPSKEECEFKKSWVKYHPDKNRGCPKEAEVKFKNLNELCELNEGISSSSRDKKRRKWRKWVVNDDSRGFRIPVNTQRGPGSGPGPITLNDDSIEPVFHIDDIWWGATDDLRLTFITHRRLKELIDQSPTMKTNPKADTVIFPLEDTRNTWGPRDYLKHLIILCSLKDGQWSVRVEDNEGKWNSEKALNEKYYRDKCFGSFAQFCDYISKGGTYNLSEGIEAGGRNGGSKSGRKKSRSKKIKKKRQRKRKSLKSKRR